MTTIYPNKDGWIVIERMRAEAGIIMFFLKICALWLLLLVLGILNGTLRVKLLVPMLGQRLALPLSGVLLSLLISIVILVSLPWLGRLSASQYWLVGGSWLVLTVSFEFLFGHFVGGEPWGKLLEAYNVTSGNMWVVVLVTILVAPCVVTRIRGIM